MHVARSAAAGSVRTVLRKRTRGSVLSLSLSRAVSEISCVLHVQVCVCCVLLSLLCVLHCIPIRADGGPLFLLTVHGMLHATALRT